MNYDLIIMLAIPGMFLLGYLLGVKDGKVEGRIEQFQANR